jgi:hypothetical protein
MSKLVHENVEDYKVAVPVCKVLHYTFMFTKLMLVYKQVTNGLFLYMGLTSLTGNQFVERCNLDFPETHFHEQYSDEAIYI